MAPVKTNLVKVLSGRQLSRHAMATFKDGAKWKGKKIIHTDSNGVVAEETRSILTARVRTPDGFTFVKGFRVRKGSDVRIRPIKARQYDSMGRLVRKITYTKRGRTVTEYDPPGRLVGKRVRAKK